MVHLNYDFNCSLLVFTWRFIWTTCPIWYIWSVLSEVLMWTTLPSYGHLNYFCQNIYFVYLFIFDSILNFGAFKLLFKILTTHMVFTRRFIWTTWKIWYIWSVFSKMLIWTTLPPIWVFELLLSKYSYGLLFQFRVDLKFWYIWTTGWSVNCSLAFYQKIYLNYSTQYGHLNYLCQNIHFSVLNLF